LTRRGDGGIVRFDPWTEIQEMRRTMDDLFNRSFGYTPVDRFIGGPTAWSGGPNVDLYETADDLVFSAELPGFTQDEIQLQVTADSLQVSAANREGTTEQASTPSNGKSKTGKAGEETPSGSTAVAESRPEAMRTYHISGRPRQTVALSYALPVEIDPNKVEATFANGVLKVTMPKAEQVKPKQVQVKIEG